MKENGAVIMDQEPSIALPITCFFILKLMMILVFVALNSLPQGYVRTHYFILKTQNIHNVLVIEGYV